MPITEIEFMLPPLSDHSQVTDLIETICRDLELTCSLKETLKSYPGCVHWHYRKEKFSGTLELIWFATKPRLWAKIHPKRQAAWMTTTLPLIKQRIEEYRKEQKS